MCTSRVNFRVLHLCLQRHFLCEVQFVCQYFYKESLYPNDVALYQKKLTLSLPALGYWVGMLTVLSSHNPTENWPETSFMTSLECDCFQVFTEIKLLCQIHWCQKSIDQNVMQPEGSLKFCIVMWIISQRKKKSITTICAHVVRFCSSFNYSFAISDGLVVFYNWQKLIVECLPMSIIMYDCFMKINVRYNI